jgi:threonylcarbamoyladenosine tRNA methylthiotransferase MtaB
MRVYLESLGCRLNEAESAAWSRSLGRRGGEVVAHPELADVMVLNTCAVTAEAARKSRKLTGRLHRRNPRAKLVLTGCLAALQPERAAALAGVDLVLGNADKDRLVELLDEQLALGLSRRELATEGPFAGARTRAFVKVQDGCRNRCAFCIVTVARGEERSRPIDTVVSEINALHAAGYPEVVLTGVHLGGYGAELGLDLDTLVLEVLRQTRIPRVRLSSLEPWEIPPSFWRHWADARLCPHLHLPLQSGSDALLKRMARRCDRASYRSLVRAARAAIPGLMLTTDIIVGFPGESEQDFAQTLDLAQEIGFAHLHVFPYSPREGTAAARMSGQIDAATKQRRSRRMRALSASSRAALLTRSVGSVRPVLWEGPGEPEQSGQRRWTGLTDNYLRVETRVPAGRELEGKITPSRLIAVRGDERLEAEVLDR